MEKSKDEKAILAGDIGGTKSHLGIFVQGKQRPLLKVFESFRAGSRPILNPWSRGSWRAIPFPCRSPASE